MRTAMTALYIGAVTLALASPISSSTEQRGDPTSGLMECTGKFTLGWAPDFVHVEVPPGGLEGLTFDVFRASAAFITYDHQVRDENTNEIKEVWYRVLGHTTEIDCPFLGGMPCPTLSNGVVLQWTNETLAWVEGGSVGLPPALPNC